MVDVEKRKAELRVILAEIERDIETLQENISKLREDMDGVNKVGRAKENPKHQDNWVDMAGYAVCAGEIAAEIYGE